MKFPKFTTCVNLLVVVTVIGILIALLLPTVPSDPIRRAIRGGDLDYCKKLLHDRNVRPSAYPGYLSQSVYYKQFEICKYFIEELKTPLKDKNLLFTAAHDNDLKLFFYLIEHGAELDVNARHDVTNDTYLLRACILNNIELCKYLLENKADPNIRNKRGETPVSLAARHGNAELFQILIDAGAKIDLKTVDLLSLALIHNAAIGGSGEICQYLLDHDADPNQKNSAGAMPIHYAAKSNNPGACRVLIEAGADVNLPGKTWRKSPQSYPPVWFSLQPKQTECFKLLIDAGAKYDLHEYYYGGQTVLQFAASRGDFDLCKRLVEEGADPKQRTENSNWSLMQLSARNGHMEICQWLHEKGFKLDELTEDKNTLLHLAAMSGNSELCRWLLENGADLEARNNEWRTPLYSALQWRHLTVCQFLLEKGANLSSKDHEGKTPLQYLEAVSRHSMEHRELLPFLRSYYEKESTPPPLNDEPSKKEVEHGK